MAYTDSEPSTASITFQGVWLFDPLVAEDTVRQFLYGSLSRSRSMGIAQSGMRFAGREYPVFDFGEQIADSLAVRIDVPHGPDWADDLQALRDFATAARITTVRDNRGRSLTGALTGFTENDQDWGTQVTFTVTRADSVTGA
jgi:hypothetical protein